MFCRFIYGRRCLAPFFLFGALSLIKPLWVQTVFSAETSTADAPIVLRLNTLPSAVATSVPAETSRAVVRAFMAKYPQYKLEPFAFPGIEGMAMDQGPLMSIATGVPAHGMYVNLRQSSSYINHGFLAPLDVLLARMISDNPRVRETTPDGLEWLEDPSQDEIDKAVVMMKERVATPIWPVFYREAETHLQGVPTGKHVWALPNSRGFARAMLYRKDIFSEAGLDPERPPRDWNEFLEYTRKIRALPGKYGYMVATGMNVSWGVYSFMVSNGVRYMERDEDGRWRASFNTPAAAETIYYLLKLIR